MKTIALVGQYDAVDLFTDGPLLVDAFAEGGVDAQVAAWGENRDWSRYDAVVVRASYDYIDRPGEFYSWAHRVEGVTQLANAAATLEWNGDKRYLRDLAGAGVNTVPTVWVEPGDDPISVLAAVESDEIVVKPVTSAGSRLAARYAPADRDRAADHLRQLAKRRPRGDGPAVPGQGRRRG